MLNKLKEFLKKYYFYATSYLLAFYSVLFLFFVNQKEYTLHFLSIPLIVSFIFTTIVLVVTKLVFKKIEIFSLLSSLIVFICLSYGRFLEIGKDLNIEIGKNKIDEQIIIGLIVLTIFSLLTFLIFKYKDKLTQINKYVFLIALVLFLFSLFNVISFEMKAKRLFKPAEISKLPTDKKVKPNPSDPDIYYFIFDRYGGPKSLKEQYNFDNSKILDYLEEKGFYVSRNSTTNYPKTFLSLSSSLNMEYLDFLTKQTNGGASGDESITTPLIRNSKVAQFLRSRGYSYYTIGSWWTPTKNNPYADLSFYPKPKAYFGADEFTTGFFNTTIIASVLKTVLKDPIDVSKDPQNNIHRQAALYEFEKVNEVSKFPGPKFVFAHILMPHDPFVFDKNCQPISEEIVEKNNHQTNYINQAQCLNSKIKILTDNILKNSKNPPIIIYQADEGPFPMNKPIPAKQGWGSAETISLKEKFPIFNAYYFPEKNTDQLYQTITPVNSFRVLFNTYFDQKLPLLPDKNYVFKDEENYYKFTEVTDKVNSN